MAPPTRDCPARNGRTRYVLVEGSRMRLGVRRRVNGFRDRAPTASGTTRPHRTRRADHRGTRSATADRTALSLARGRPRHQRCALIATPDLSRPYLRCLTAPHSLVCGGPGRRWFQSLSTAPPWHRPTNQLRSCLSGTLHHLGSPAHLVAVPALRLAQMSLRAHSPRVQHVPPHASNERPWHLAVHKSSG